MAKIRALPVKSRYLHRLPSLAPLKLGAKLPRSHFSPPVIPALRYSKPMIGEWCYS